jgi:hypothetical protein
VDPDERRIALSVKSLQLSKGEEDYQAYLRQQGDGKVSLGEALKSKGIDMTGLTEAEKSAAEAVAEGVGAESVEEEEKTAEVEAPAGLAIPDEEKKETEDKE